MYHSTTSTVADSFHETTTGKSSAVKPAKSRWWKGRFVGQKIRLHTTNDEFKSSPARSFTTNVKLPTLAPGLQTHIPEKHYYEKNLLWQRLGHLDVSPTAGFEIDGRLSSASWRIDKRKESPKEGFSTFLHRKQQHSWVRGGGGDWLALPLS
jgi:hypothetical protein